MPYHGTPLYERLKQENRFLYDGKWWLHPQYRFNSPWSIITRALEPGTNMRSLYRFFTYLVYNPLFRKEVFKKQGMELGLECASQQGEQSWCEEEKH